MIRKRTGRLVALVMTLVVASITMSDKVEGAPNSAVGKITHGTANELITEDMVNNTPPVDYKVNTASQGMAEYGRYNTYFLEDEIQTVHIEIEENNLNYLLQNAIDEPDVMTKSVTIGDTILGYCGLKTKGAYTLAHSYTDNAGSDRFSFTVNFGTYIKKADYGEKQNFYGCDKISFNNFFFDKSMMKEFFSLKLMEEMGLPTPQYGLAKLYINDEYYGLYAMVEAMDEPILEQYYGVSSDELSSYLCKPEGTTFLYDDILEDASPLWEEDEDTYKDVEERLPTVKEWVKKLNLLSEGKDFDGKMIDVQSYEYLELLGQVLDLDEVVKYFAAHSWLCQTDNMFVNKKNFGLYVDQIGKAMIVPWDYDLSFGCYYPGTSQLTANYDIDAMYMLGNWGQDISNVEISDTAYEAYPLFDVIFQNDELMKKYHNYMKECSKIAVLGGTIESNGKSYNPGYFNSYIEKMKDDIIEAASQELADHVYYMNHINQPNDVKLALPNLSNIIALRAVGVMLQVDGIDSTVSGATCDLSTLGNASRGENKTDGTLSLVHPSTGLFVTAEYLADNVVRKIPFLIVKTLEKDDAAYTNIQEATGCTSEDRLLVYDIKNNIKSTSDYTVTIPLDKSYMENNGEIKFYSYTDGELTQLNVTSDDNLYSVTVDNLKYIAILQVNEPVNVIQQVNESVNANLQGNESVNSIGSWQIICIILVITIIVLAAISTMLVRKRKKVNQSNKTV